MQNERLKPLFILVRLFLARESSRKLQGKGILFYLKTLRAVRGGTLGVLVFFLFLQTMMISFLGALTAGVFLLIDDQHARLVVLLGVFGVMFLIPFIAVIALFSEKLWYRASGAEKMVDEFTLNPSHIRAPDRLM